MSCTNHDDIWHSGFKQNVEMFAYECISIFIYKYRCIVYMSKYRYIVYNYKELQCMDFFY